MIQYRSSLSAIKYPIILITWREWRWKIIHHSSHLGKINDTERETDAALAIQLYIEHGLLAERCDWVRELHCMLFLQAYPTTEKDEEQVRSIHQLNVETNQYRNAVVLEMKYVPPTTWCGMIRGRERLSVHVFPFESFLTKCVARSATDRREWNWLCSYNERFVIRIGRSVADTARRFSVNFSFHFSSYSFFSSFVMPPMHWLVISPTTAPTHFRSSSTDDAAHRIWIRSLDRRRFLHIRIDDFFSSFGW